jgi:hypothetical protein
MYYPFTYINKKFPKYRYVTMLSAMDIASASGTRRPGFESPQDIRFLGKHLSAVVYKMA